LACRSRGRLGVRLQPARATACHAAAACAFAERIAQADATSLFVLRRRGRSGLPLDARGRRPVPGRRDGARWARVAVSSGVSAELHAAHATSRFAWLRSRRTERPRLEWLRETLRAPRRRAAAFGLCPRPGGASRLAWSAPRARRVTRRALRALLRWVHGARGARVPAGALGGGNRDGGHLELRHVPGEHRALAARGPRARVRDAGARSRLPDRRVPYHTRRADPRAALHPARRQRPARTARRDATDPSRADREGYPLRARRAQRRGTCNRQAREPR